MTEHNPFFMGKAYSSRTSDSRVYLIVLYGDQLVDLTQTVLACFIPLTVARMPQ